MSGGGGGCRACSTKANDCRKHNETVKRNVRSVPFLRASMSLRVMALILHVRGGAQSKKRHPYFKVYMSGLQ